MTCPQAQQGLQGRTPNSDFSGLCIDPMYLLKLRNVKYEGNVLENDMSVAQMKKFS